MTDQSKRQKSVTRVIIDTDPGVDDALAILLAFGSPNLVVEGLTIVCGNGKDIKKLGLTARATAAIALHAALMRSCAMPPDDPAHSARGASHSAAVPRS